jgi:hypothetical protein
MKQFAKAMDAIASPMCAVIGVLFALRVIFH